MQGEKELIKICNDSLDQERIRLGEWTRTKGTWQQKPESRSGLQDCLVVTLPVVSLPQLEHRVCL